MQAVASDEAARAILAEFFAGLATDMTPISATYVWAQKLADAGLTLKAQLKQLAKGLTPREVLDKFKTIQMVDVHVPTADGRQLVLSRHTQPEPEHRVLLDLLRLKLPQHPPPKITARQTRQTAKPCAV